MADYDRTRPVTISDVAKAAGVGLGTVSRVLNDHPNVSADTRQRVLDAIARLGYRPNAQARRLAKGSTETICFILSNRSFMHSFHGRILQGVEAHCSTTRHQVVYAAFRYPPNVPPSALELPHIMTARGVVDGLIVAGTNYPNFLEVLESIDLPYVLFGNNLIGEDEPRLYDTVSSDDEGGGYVATCHLIELGHRVIAFVGNTEMPWFRRRHRGYIRAMSDAGLSPLKVDSADDSVNHGLGAVREIIRNGMPVTAIFAANDHLAYGVWRGLREAGLHIPDDVSVVGFDDREEALLIEPPLTTIRVFKQEIGAECARMLLRKIENPRTRCPSVVLPTEFLTRGSTSPLQDEKGLGSGFVWSERQTSRQ